MPVPDAVDLVLECAAMESTLAAQRLIRIDAMRRELLLDAEGRGSATAEIIERSIRLELAAAMRITEYSAGRMIVHAEALVRRYPQVLDSLHAARITPKHAEVLADDLDQLMPELRGQVVDRALVLAEAEPVGTFRRALRTLLATVQAASLEERYRSRPADAARGDRARIRRRGRPAASRTRGRPPGDLRSRDRDSQDDRRRRRRDQDARSGARGCSLRPPHRWRHRRDAVRGAGYPRAGRRDRAGAVASRRGAATAPPTRPWSRESDPSRCRSPKSCAAATDCGCGFSPTPRPEWCSPSGATSIVRPPCSAGWSSGEPIDAWLPDAGCRRRDARSTIKSIGSSAVRRRSRTTRRSARAITSSNTTAIGRSGRSTAAAEPWSGSRPRDEGTSCSRNGGFRCSG